MQECSRNGAAVPKADKEGLLQFSKCCEVKTSLPPRLRERLEKQGYHLLGGSAAFKPCQWQQKSLLEDRACYKERFYGISSHRCVQMTPVVHKCTHQCRFCWRITPSDLGIEWNQLEVGQEEVMDPEELLDAVLMANVRSLGGYNPEAGASVPQEKYVEARSPKHVAISLAGEPTLYPRLGEFIDVIHRRGMTSFLVTNGTRPRVLRSLIEPTQLYITLTAPDEKTYRRISRPMIKNGWEQLQEAQELLQSMSCRTANRLTMVFGHNMHHLRGYAKLILGGLPDFVEVKGYMFLGASRARLKHSNMPSHREIRAFAAKLAALTGYYVQDEQVESRVVLLSKSRRPPRIRT